MSLDARHKKWEFDHDLLEKDHDKLVEWWIKNKPCDCDTEEYDIFCKHFDRIVNTTLGKRVDKLWDERLQIGFQTLDVVIRK